MTLRMLFTQQQLSILVCLTSTIRSIVLYAAIKEGSLPSDGGLDAFSKVFDDLSIHASGGYNLIMLNNRLYVPGPARPRLL